MELLWTDFVNSLWHDWRGSGRSADRLEQPAWLAEFLAGHRLSAPVPPAPAEQAALKQLRALLRRLAESLGSGQVPGPDELAALNRALAGGPVIRQVAGDGGSHRLELWPVGHGWPQVIAAIAASFASTLTAGDAARVRICANPDCRWVFLDETRNRAKRFCDHKSCGNLVKVRRFRARRKAADREAAAGSSDTSGLIPD